MKRIAYLVLLVAGVCNGQNEEFQTYANGLIYDESTMNKLGSIVDSLNLKFKTCDLSHPYYSFEQGEGVFVSVPNKTARNLIEAGISIDEYIRKYPKNDDKRSWIVKSYYTNYRDKPVIEYSGLPYGWGSEPSITVPHRRSNDKQSGWILDNEGEFALYIYNLVPKEIPYEYARLVQYVDCMIDTTAEIYLPNAKSRVYQQVEESSKASQFIKWAMSYPNEPQPPNYSSNNNEKWYKDYDVYLQEYSKWDSLRLLHVDQELRHSHYWKSLLMQARDEALSNGNSSETLEFYIGKYLSKEDELQLKRSRIVVGNCSQDQSPRFHAMRICKLSAETTRWDIFLRSHLDIMNDRFERMSDGSYAWGGRLTYLKELEELDINAVDLLLGTCLRVNNVSDKHYRGSIGRVGRALADASDKEALEARLTAMIKNDQLDTYNRLLILYLYSNYAYNLADDGHAEKVKKSVEELAMSMPDHIRSVWTRGKK